MNSVQAENGSANSLIYPQTSRLTTKNTTGRIWLRIHYLNENPVRLRNHLEQEIGGPANCDERIPPVTRRHHVSELDYAPGQHCGGEGHRKSELDVVAGVVVAAGEVRVVHPSITQSRVSAPSQSLILRQETGALAFEKQNRFC
ncbi:hypothetical protein SLE2022_200650 [Rubroshorea leprosula]